MPLTDRSWIWLRLTMWFALVTALGEIALLLLFQNLNLLGWSIGLVKTPTIIGVATIPVVLVVFVLASGIAWAVGRMLGPDSRARLLIGTLLFLATYDWLGVLLTGRLRGYAILLLAAGVGARLAWVLDEARVARLVRGTWRPTASLAAVVVAVSIGGPRASEYLRERALPPPERPDRPNVLVVVLDTVRADHLSAYGYPRQTTPRIDGLAARGVIFDAAISPSSWTLPSHASMLTGLYTSQHGAVDIGDALTGRTVLPDRMAQLGYRNAAFSANSTFFSRAQGFGKGFLRFEDCCHTIGDLVGRTLFGRQMSERVLKQLGWPELVSLRGARSIAESALTWIDRDPHRPFFVFLNMFDAHGPELPPMPDRVAFARRPERLSHMRFDNTRVHWKTANDLQVADLVDGYDASIRYADWWVGWLLDALDSRGRLANTVVVLVSDHGELLRDEGPFIGHHSSVSRAEIHVPLIIAGPGVPMGIRVAAPVTTVAIARTILELVGAPVTGFGTHSLTGFFRATPDEQSHFAAIAELAPERLEPTRMRAGWERALVADGWYYVEKARASARLFKWDPALTPGKPATDVSGTTAGREVATRLAGIIRSKVGELPGPRQK